MRLRDSIPPSNAGAPEGNEKATRVSKTICRCAYMQPVTTHRDGVCIGLAFGRVIGCAKLEHILKKLLAAFRCLGILGLAPSMEYVYAERREGSKCYRTNTSIIAHSRITYS